MKKKNTLLRTGLGVDIEEIIRFEEHLKDKKFLSIIFTHQELSYCFARKKPAPHLAVRYAAKEAIIKGFCHLNIRPPAMHEIEIFKNENKVPLVTIKNSNYVQYDVKISLSHSRSNAIAFSLIQLRGN